MNNFQDIVLPQKKPFEINSQKTATNPLAPEKLFTSGSTAGNSNSIPAPTSPTAGGNFFTSQNVEDSNSFAQFLTQPQFLGAVPNTSPSASTNSDTLTGEKIATQAETIAASQLPDTSAPERQAKNSNLPIGVFQVGASGQVSADYLFDSG